MRFRLRNAFDMFEHAVVASPSQHDAIAAYRECCLCSRSPSAGGNDQPMRRNSPTAPDLVIRDERDLGAERERLNGLIDRFAAGGPAGCTTHPHTFFGPMTPQEWATLMYKHLDHHLRQFGA